MYLDQGTNKVFGTKRRWWRQDKRRWQRWRREEKGRRREVNEKAVYIDRGRKALPGREDAFRIGQLLTSLQNRKSRANEKKQRQCFLKTFEDSVLYICSTMSKIRGFELCLIERSGNCNTQLPMGIFVETQNINISSDYVLTIISSTAKISTRHLNIALA